MPKKSAGVRSLSAKGLKFGIVVSRFNSAVTGPLLAGAVRTLRRLGAADGAVEIISVPGAFEIPIALQRLAGGGRRARKGRRFDALIALGAVIRGQTPHFEFVAGSAAQGVMSVSLAQRIPIAFGILTTNNVKQALDRAGGRCGNKGEEAALVAIEMARARK